MDTSFIANLNYKQLFEGIPGLYLAFLPDTPRFTIVAASDDFTFKTLCKKEEILGKGIFEIFPENPSDPKNTTVANMKASLERVIQNKARDSMPVQRYDIRKPSDEGGGFEKRYWSPINSPIIEENGQISFIISRTEDVTEFIHLKMVGSQRTKYSESLKRKEPQLQEVQRRENFGSGTYKIRTDHRQWSDELHRIYGMELQKTVPDRNYVRHDITERKEIMDKLLESENKFRGLLETAYDSIIIVDEEGLIEFANRQTKTWLGYDPGELIGKPIELLLPDRFSKSHRDKRAEYIKHPSSRPMGRNLELSAKRKDGSECPVEISLSPFKTSRGTIVTAFLRDMTDQRRAENQQKFLAETSRILSETMDYQERIQRITSTVVPTLADWCVSYMFEEGQLKLKASAQDTTIDIEIVRRLVQNNCLVSENTKLTFGSIAKAGVSQLIKTIDDEVLYELTSGDEHCMQQFRNLGVQGLILAPMKARRNTIGIICFARCRSVGYSEKDLAYANLIAERAALAIDNAKLYQDAQNATRLREDILAIVSHDLKNPLGTIRGFNEILSECFAEIDSQSKEIKYTEAIARSVRQMERLIGDLLNFAKIESGSLDIETRSCAVDRVVWEGVELVKKHADNKNIRIEIKISPNLSEIICDLDRMRQVLGNILGNAIKFSPEKGVIKICAKLSDSRVEFSVTDQGPGIPIGNFSHIFDRYWQAKETAKLGNGLGLSIAKGIVESHRGRIWVESTVGQGTTFFFTIPIFEKDFEKKSTPKGETSGG